MILRRLASTLLLSLAIAAPTSGCSSSSTAVTVPPFTPPEAGAGADTGTPPVADGATKDVGPKTDGNGAPDGAGDGSVASDGGVGAPGSGGLAKAQAAFVKSGATTSASITVEAIVTAIQGPTGDQVIWYVEDAAGGPYSGVSVFCDPLAAKTCPCMASCTPHVAAPPLHTKVSITGTLSTYHGQVQLTPTAQTILEMNATPPPTYIAAAADLAETGTSPYRGVYVRFPTTVKVDDLTPSALYDSQCSTGTAVDGGMPLCTGCSPPTYAGFEVNGPGPGAFFVEETFFPFVTLANSPECVTQSGAVPVTKGETFPFMAGILDVDPYAGRQVLAPIGPSDYTK